VAVTPAREPASTAGRDTAQRNVERQLVHGTENP
jgi:hypothetical protein